MLILYITYVDINSGHLRIVGTPQKMYRAFLDAGHEVKLLSGAQQRWGRKARTEAVQEIRRWLRENRPDICYIESPSMPITFRCDIALIRKISRMGIPIGYFYRDFYWMFPELYPRRTDLTGWLKDHWLDYLQQRTNNVLKCADIVYFPSEECKKYFSYTDMRSLPPAGEDHLSERCPRKRPAYMSVGWTAGTASGAA